MNTLLVVLQLTLVSQVPVEGSEQPVSEPPPESKRGMTIDFEDDTIQLEPVESGLECFPDRRYGPYRLIRMREDFNDKVMKSVAEM
jgi:hypothetical protein